MATIGIDFGTTNCVAATFTSGMPEVLMLDTPPLEWQPYGFDRVLPSVFAQDERARMTFGWEAKTSSGSRFEAVKRLFATQQDLAFGADGDALQVEEAATLLFAEIRRRAEATGVAARQAVITVPANSKGRARHRTKICAGMGGFEVLGLINEPTAAAMAYAQRNSDGRNYVVFDWGGGTLDVTVLQATEGVFIERASSGLPRSGGLDFDARLNKAVTESLAQEFEWTAPQRSAFRLEIELAKIRLSQAEVATLRLPDGSPYRLTRDRFEEIVMPLIEESRVPLERCFRDLGVGPGSVDALVLVGGTCKIPAVRSFVRSLVGVDPDPDIDPMTAIGEGAAIAASILAGDNQDHDFFVSTEHALGTVVMNPNSGELEFSTLIPKNHKLPAKATSSYVPVVAGQTQVQIEVVEGDPDTPIADFVTLKQWSVSLPDSAEDQDAFDLTYEYDVSGILHVTAVDQRTGSVLLADDVSYGVAEDKRKLTDIARRAQQAVTSGQFPSSGASSSVLDPEAVELIQRATVKVIPFLDDDESLEVSSRVLGLENADPADVPSAKAALTESLAPYSYLF
jgi:molecular chaperone DnaK (HSP70)